MSSLIFKLNYNYCVLTSCKKIKATRIDANNNTQKFINFRFSIMPRTKGEGGAARSVGAKAPRKALGGGGGSSAATRAITAASEGKRGGGGAAYNPLGQPVPDWQLKMTAFLKKDHKTDGLDEEETKDQEKQQ